MTLHDPVWISAGKATVLADASVDTPTYEIRDEVTDELLEVVPYYVRVNARRAA